MQAREKKLAPCPRKIVIMVARRISCHTTSGIPQSLTLYCLRRGNHIDVYAVEGRLEEYIGDIARQENIAGDIVTIGVHIARLVEPDKTDRGAKLAPMLGLAQLMRRYTGIVKGYAVVNEHAEKLFLYGRDILQESIVELKPPPKTCKNIIVVLNKQLTPLGWGRIARRAERIYIQNLVDAGWYLRSGV